jgi:hypothetical protein
VTGAPQGLHPNARSAFEVTSFEEVRATPATSLLRLTGRWNGIARPPAAPALLIDAGGRQDRLLPLAGPAPESGSVWRAGYAIPPDALATPGVALHLDTGSGELLPLPLPSRVRAPSIGPSRRTAAGRSSSTAQARQGASSLRLSDEDRRERDKSDRLTRELERAHREVERLQQLEARVLRSEAALAAAEAQVETLRAQLHEAREHAAGLAARRGRETS